MAKRVRTPGGEVDRPTKIDDFAGAASRTRGEASDPRFNDIQQFIQSTSETVERQRHRVVSTHVDVPYLTVSSSSLNVRRGTYSTGGRFRSDFVAGGGKADDIKMSLAAATDFLRLITQSHHVAFQRFQQPESVATTYPTQAIQISQPAADQRPRRSSWEQRSASRNHRARRAPNPMPGRCAALRSTTIAFDDLTLADRHYSPRFHVCSFSAFSICEVLSPDRVQQPAIRLTPLRVLSSTPRAPNVQLVLGARITHRTQTDRWPTKSFRASRHRSALRFSIGSERV